MFQVKRSPRFNSDLNTVQKMVLILLDLIVYLTRCLLTNFSDKVSFLQHNVIVN